MHVSIIDDEKILAGKIAKKFEMNGFVVSAFYGYREFVNSAPDSQLYIVDISLGDGSGFDVITWLRNERKVRAPIILISGYGDNERVIKGLDIGADDYLIKPFLPEVLVARARAIIRRSGGSVAKEEVRKLGKLVCHPPGGAVTYDGKPLVLTRNERLMLETLMERAEWIVPRDELISRVWGRQAEVTDNTICVTLSNLRRKIGEGCRIKAVYNQGYVIERA